MSPVLHLTQDPEADELLSKDPLALLLGMLLDQQIPMEKAFSGPKVLVERIGRLDAAEIAAMDPEKFATICSTPPAVHRFPGSMAKRLQSMCQALVERYDGDAAQIWTAGDPDGAAVLKRMKALPGFGEQKAKIFVALLGKRYDVRPAGWREAAAAYGEDGSFRSVADVVDAESLGKVRAFKKEAKAAAKSS